MADPIDPPNGLIASFEAYLQVRSSDSAWDTSEIHEVCQIVESLPAEPGLNLPGLSDPDSLLTPFLSTTSLLPESKACRALANCYHNIDTSESLDCLSSLAAEPLWEPVKTRVFRALAFLGRRDLLTNLVPDKISHLDALLECLNQQADLWKGFKPAFDCNWLPPELQVSWAQLINMELTLANDENLSGLEEGLFALANQRIPPGLPALVCTEAQRITARALAAYLRLRLARGLPQIDWSVLPASQWIPDWEGAFLLGLFAWSSGDQANAREKLALAFDLNPKQSSARQAFGAFLAEQNPQEALLVLDCPAPTRDIQRTRAVVLTRLGKYDEATLALDLCKNCPSEALRYTWRRSKAQGVQQEAYLRSALAEQRGDWANASTAWKADESSSKPATGRPRLLYIAQRELKSLPLGQAWRHTRLAQGIERGISELSASSLAGDDLYFRALACIDREPERLVRDFETLLHRRSWFEAERRVGGNRLVLVGDILWRMGRAQSAIRAYELAGPPAAERLAIARICQIVVNRGSSQDLLSSVSEAKSQFTGNPWIYILATLGLLCNGETSQAEQELAGAVQAGAPAALAQALHSLAAWSSGQTPEPCNEIDQLGMPDVAGAVLRLGCAPEPEEVRIENYIRKNGARWFESCPVDPAQAACLLLSTWCSNGDWDKALNLANELDDIPEAWAHEMAATAKLWNALEIACRGRLDEADRLLGQIRIKE